MSMFNAAIMARLLFFKHKIFLILCMIMFAQRIHAAHDNMFEINRSCVMIPERLGNVALCHDDDGFSVIKGDEIQSIKKYWADESIRDIDNATLEACLAKGYLALNQMSDGEYTLKFKTRGPGGGPIAAWALYTATKTICYGTGVAAVGVGAGALGTGIGGAALGLAGVAATSGASVATTATGAIITGAGYAAVATEATTAVVAAGGSLAGAMAMIEAAASVAFMAGLSCPFLP